MSKTKRRKKKSNSVAAVLLIVSALLLIAVAFGVKYWYDVTHPASLFDPPERTAAPAVTASTTPTGDVDASATPEPTPTPDPLQSTEEDILAEADMSFMRDRVNILVLGVDESTERANWGTFRTDTMLLVTIDFSTNAVTMISVPRDSYVKIYNGNGIIHDEEQPYAKINGAFSKGGGAKKNGWAYSMRTVEETLRVPVDYYFGFNMNVVKEVVDAMGGVDYDVDVEINMNGRHLDTGFQHLSGQSVLDYCRQRHGSSDIARIDRQQRMLMAILQQLKSTGRVTILPKLYEAVSSNIATNLSFAQISSLCYVALQMDMADLDRHTVPTTGVTVDGSSCLGIRADKLQSLIKDVFGVRVTVDPEIDYDFIAALVESHKAMVAAAQTLLTEAEGYMLLYPTDAQLAALYETLSKAVEDTDYYNMQTHIDALSAYVALIPPMPTATPELPAPTSPVPTDPAPTEPTPAA